MDFLMDYELTFWQVKILKVRMCVRFLPKPQIEHDMTSVSPPV